MMNPKNSVTTEENQRLLLMSAHSIWHIETSPIKIIDSIVQSRMSLEDKLAKFLVNKFLSETQKSTWVTNVIELGADATTRNHVALRWAAEHGDLALVKLTLDKGCDIHCLKDEPLSRAALKGHLDVVDYLLDQGAQVHAKDDVALRLASSMGFEKIVSRLIEAGANVAAKKNEPIRKAFDGGHFGVVKQLFQHNLKEILQTAQAEQDWQIFAIAWQYAKSTDDEKVMAELIQYDYRPKQASNLGL